MLTPDLLRAGDRNLAAVLRHAARTTEGGVVGGDDRLVLISTSATWPGPYHNGALRLDASLAPEEVLDRAAEFFAGRTSGYCVWIAAHADGDLEAAALDAGLLRISETGGPRMALHTCPPLPPVPDGVVLHEVSDDADYHDYFALTLEAYGPTLMPETAAIGQMGSLAALCAPGVRAVLARENGAAVSAAMVVVSDRVAGIQLVGTVPAARGRGLAELCTAWAVRAGFELGAEAAVLEASEMGEPVYLRMGFVEVSRYRWCFGAT